MRRVRGISLVAGLAMVAVGVSPHTANAALVPSVSGAVSWDSALAALQWSADIMDQIQVVPRITDEMTALDDYVNGSVDFAMSEMPFTTIQLQELSTSARGASFVYAPVALSGASIVFNLTDRNGTKVSSLDLPAHTLCSIFTGQIKMWNDPRISQANPNIALPSLAITPVVHAEPSAQARVLSSYCHVFDPSAWRRFTSANGIPDAKTNVWPTPPGFVAEDGNDLLAHLVVQGSSNGDIGFADVSWAEYYHLPIAAISNETGDLVSPTTVAIQAAVANAPSITHYMHNVVVAPSAEAYPLSLISFAIAQTTGLDPTKGATLRAFLDFAIGAGQSQLEEIGYAPLPANLVALATKRINKIP